ncbi:MAG: class I SAM-dependent methyltransferase [Anaerolineae bacterium]|jgi:ubiquinone/menaquinone biosynthesis C-methylase UbiE|nr:class I SAM-dependent methyltransferase [Anaerolineae bacterium]
MKQLPFQNTEFLKNNQYTGADKLAARIRFHQKFGSAKRDLHLWQMDYILPVAPPQAAVLECGAGRGDFWQKNAKVIPSGWQITLSDLSEGMLDDAKAYLGADLAARLQFEVFDVQQIPHPEAQFDVVIANHMLYHVADLPRALSEIRRVLKPEGVFFALTNGTDHLQELEAIHQRISGSPGLMMVRGAFDLENAVEKLQTVFQDVKMLRFKDALRVTELPTLLAYLASTIDDADTVFNTPENQAYLAELQAQIDRDGFIPVTKTLGLLIAR